MRKLFQFSVRDLFWLVLVGAIAAGWVADRRVLLREQDTAKAKDSAQIRELNSKILRLTTLPAFTVRDPG